MTLAEFPRDRQLSADRIDVALDTALEHDDRNRGCNWRPALPERRHRRHAPPVYYHARWTAAHRHAAIVAPDGLRLAVARPPAVGCNRAASGDAGRSARPR